MPYALIFLVRHFAIPVLNHITRPMASFWWVGPLMAAFAWVVVPIMRLSSKALDRGDYSRAARFWWAPGWAHVGLVGLGLCLVAAPLLHPALAARWAPSAWLGMQAALTLLGMGGLAAAGAFLVILGFLGYLKAWIRDYKLRYRAWRWRMGAAPRLRRRVTK